MDTISHSPTQSTTSPTIDLLTPTSFGIIQPNVPTDLHTVSNVIVYNNNNTNQIFNNNRRHATIMRTVHARAMANTGNSSMQQSCKLMNATNQTIANVQHSTFGFLSEARIMELSAKNHHFEVAAGLGWNDFIGRPAKFTLGYRYQKPTGKFLLRAGLGLPDGLYLGAGFRF